MLDRALKFLKSGHSVIPLKPKSKEPLIPWTEYQKRKATEDEVKQWWTTTPDANIGLVTGTISCLAVVDLDGAEGIASGLSLNLVSNTVVKTGNGLQYYYRDPEGLCRNSVKKIANGVDTRGLGGYIVAPPSIHPNGKRYIFLRSVPGVANLPLFPAKLFAPVASTQDGSITTSGASSSANEKGWIAKALEEMTNGNIDDTLFKICSRLRNDGLTEIDAKALLGPHASRVGAADGHLEEKIRNVWNRYAPKLGVRTAPSSDLSGLVIHSPTNSDSQQQYSDSQLAVSAVSEYPTGYQSFDKLTSGLRRSHILTVAARTGVGKTNWLIGPARTLCEAGKKVLLFSTEMSFDQIWERYRATLKDDGEFANHSFYVCDDFAPNAERVEEALRLIQPDVFMFDHANNVSDENIGLSEFMKGLKMLARKFNIPCILAAQLNRNADWVEKGERVAPRLSMIKGCGGIEEISSQVLLLSETRVHSEGTEIVGEVAKNRYGQKGTINFMLKQNPWRIEEVK